VDHQRERDGATICVVLPAPYGSSESPSTVRPDAPETHERCGNRLIEAGKFDEAAAELRRAVELGPQLGSAWSSLGFSLRGLRDLPGSANHLSDRLAAAMELGRNAIVPPDG
jgi:Flp pilus assembly protein TadD